MSIIEEKLALGTVQFGLDYGISNLNGQTKKEEANAILNYCLRNGIKFIDTARAYGSSEEVIGAFSPDGFSIISKFFIDKEFPTLQQNLDCSLQKLHTSKLYAYMAHDANQLIDFPFLWNELQDLKADGKIQKIGYSLYRPEQLKSLLDNGVLPDIVQVPYNIFDNRFEPFFPQLKKTGCEIHTRSAFLQGLFFMKVDSLNDHFKTVKKYLNELHHLYNNSEERAAYLLQFCLQNKYIDKVVFGVNTLSQIQNNLLKLSDTKFIHFNDFVRPAHSVPDSVLMPDLWPVNN